MRFARAALALLATLLLLRAIHMRGRPWLVDGPLWDLNQSSHLKAIFLNLALIGIGQVFVYGFTGFFAVQCVAWCRDTMLAQGRSLLRALAFGIGLSALASTAASGPGLRWPNLLDLILPFAGCLVGGWIGIRWTGGKSARRWIGLKLTLLGSSGLIVLAVLVLLMIDPEPLGFEPVEPDSVDRVRLTELIRSKSPREIPEGRTVTLSLTEHDINVLLAWGLSFGSPHRKARIELADNLATIQVSIHLSADDRSPRYLNLLVAGRVGVDKGRVSVHLARVRVGRLDVPRPLLWLVSPALAGKIQSAPLAAPVLAAIHRTDITQEYVSGTYQRIDMPEGFRNDLFGSLGPDAQVYDALSAQFEQISRLSRAQPISSTPFEDFVQAAFGLAQARSMQGDPVVENRAAIVALGISLGHHYIGKFIGTLPHDQVPELSSSFTRRVRLRGRVDWRRHFLVSAALEVISSESLSLDAGVLKEELDAGSAGGSGFSFADLAADRSGTLFAKIATRDAGSAAALQRRLRAGFNVDDYVPELDDLPENILQQRLDAEYGGVNGVQYRRLLNEIDRRLMTCTGYAVRSSTFR